MKREDLNSVILTYQVKEEEIADPNTLFASLRAKELYPLPSSFLQKDEFTIGYYTDFSARSTNIFVMKSAADYHQVNTLPQDTTIPCVPIGWAYRHWWVGTELSPSRVW